MESAALLKAFPSNFLDELYVGMRVRSEKSRLRERQIGMLTIACGGDDPVTRQQLGLLREMQEFPGGMLD